jgi:PAS domain-containing protein
MTFRDHIARVTSQMSPEERSRLLSHGLALGAVAAAVIVRWMLGVSDIAAAFWLFDAVVAISALYGGWSPATVAALSSLLVVRIGSGISLLSCGLFFAEALFIAAVLLQLKRALERQRRRTSAADAKIQDLKRIERSGRILDTAFGRLQQAADDVVVTLLDEEGKVAEWGVGAERLLARGVDGVLGVSGAALFEPPLADADFARLLATSRDGVARHSGRLKRGDGTSFDADVEIRPLSKGRFGGFTMVVSDRSRQQAWEAFARSSADTQTELREEVDVARHQLATLQSVTDPALDVLAGSVLITTLLNRLRAAVGADGIALVHAGSRHPSVFCASDGLQCLDRIKRPYTVTSGPGQSLLIHNDAARVADMSAVEWPQAVVSLIAVPVVRAGTVQGVVEVVNTRGRRSTEWDIALVGVAAMRIGGLIKDESYAGADRVA